MSPTPDREGAHEDYRDDLAAYALGALDDGEAGDLREHLQECESCRKHLRWLQPAVDLLPRTVQQLEPPRRLRRRLMSTVRAEAREPAAARAERPRRREWGALLWRPATAAAAGALLVAGGAAGYLLHTSGEGSSVLAAKPVRGAPRASGTLERQDGAGILSVRGMPSLSKNRVYEVWIRRDGTMQPSSLFAVRSDRSGEAAVPAPLDGADAVLVTKEPLGGSAQPTSSPLLRVQLH